MSSQVPSLVDRKVGTRIATMLQESQHKYGYLVKSEIERICDQVGEPLNVIQDVISFFPHYRLTPPPKCDIQICRDMSCRLRGSIEAARHLKQWKVSVESSHAKSDPIIEFHEASCLGRCDRAPAALINDQLFVGRTPEELIKIAEAILNGEHLTPDTDSVKADQSLSRGEIDCYRNKQPSPAPYQAVRNFVRNPDPDEVISILERAGLFGMGGAGAPTFRKWKDAFEAQSETKYVVCNADESEPGTFKDRDILLAGPHLVIEGMVLAALVIGADQGFIYIRHEYHEQIATLKSAIESAERLGACGANIFGSGRSFELRVFISPGGYVCGEQTALIEALEGKRSEPRNRPPELETNGLYDQPTVLNNVETFAWVPAILLADARREHIELENPPAQAEILSNKSDSNEPRGDDVESSKYKGLWYKYSGRNNFRCKRFFSISGDVGKPGAYEVPCGITLGELIDEFGGSMRDRLPLLAVALSGPSGGFLPAKLPKGVLRTPKKLGPDRKVTDEYEFPDLAGDAVDVRLLPLDIPISRQLGFLVGAGIVVYGQGTDMLDQAVSCSRFFQRESCGKCVPCRIGSRKIADMSERLQHGELEQFGDELETNVASLSKMMCEPGVCICALGASASQPFVTYLKYFRNLSQVESKG